MTQPLVAAPVDGTAWFTGTGVLDYAMTAKTAFQSGDVTEGLLNTGVAALSALGAIADPLAYAISAGVGWVLEHCGPLRQALDWLAGQPPVINSFAATWQNVSGALDAAADRLTTAVRADTAGMDSAALDAYRLLIDGQAALIRATGVAASGVGAAVTLGGVVVATVRCTVRDLVAEAVGNIVSKALQALFVVTIPKVVAEIVALVAKWSMRIASFLRKLVQVMTRLAELCKRLKPVFDKADEVNRAMMTRFGGAVSVAGRPTNASAPFTAGGNAVSVGSGAAWPDQ
jgi:hypothetical protein